MRSERTKRLHAVAFLLGCMRWACFILAGVFISIIIGQSSGGMLKKIEHVLGPVLWSYALSILIFIALAMITKDKIKPLVWTANLILSNIIWGANIMYLIFALSLVDNYVITPLYGRIKTQYIANKEIDKRL